MSDSGSEAGDREGEREDKEILRDVEDDEDRSERRRRDHSRETEQEESAAAEEDSKPATADVARTECCSACLSKNRNNGRSCICQVPARQRRAPLGTEGCITCKCTGCHPEDILNAPQGDGEERSKSNGERRSHRDNKEREPRDREARYDDSAKDRDREKDQRVREKEARSRDRASPSANGEEVPLKNGCCRPCMKAFSDHKRACLCQVPVDVRMGHLPEAGCKICGCHGCHPEEKSVRRSAYPPSHINPYTRAPMASGGYLHPPPIAPFYPPLLPLGGRSRDPRDARDVRDYHHHHPRDVRDPRDARNGRDVRDRDVRDRDNRDFRSHREPHLDDRRGGLLPFPPPFPYPLPRPEYDPYRGRVDPRFDRDGLYARERDVREREAREREARERYMSTHRDDRMDRERALDRARGHEHEDRDRREHERERERERERRDRDRGEHDYNRKRDRAREAEHFNESRDSKRSRELL